MNWTAHKILVTQKWIDGNTTPKVIVGILISIFFPKKPDASQKWRFGRLCSFANGMIFRFHVRFQDSTLSALFSGSWESDFPLTALCTGILFMDACTKKQQFEQWSKSVETLMGIPITAQYNPYITRWDFIALIQPTKVPWSLLATKAAVKASEMMEEVYPSTPSSETPVLNWKFWLSNFDLDGTWDIWHYLEDGPPLRIRLVS